MTKKYEYGTKRLRDGFLEWQDEGRLTVRDKYEREYSSWTLWDDGRQETLREYVVYHGEGQYVLVRRELTAGPVEVVSAPEPPLPTVPGFYRAGNGEGRVFILTGDGSWNIVYVPGTFNVMSMPARIVKEEFHNFTRIEL